MASAPRTSLDERARERFEPRHFDLGAQHVGLRRGAARVSGVGGGHDVAGEGDLLGDQRRRAPALLQHQEGVGGLNADIQRGPARFGAQPIDIRQRGRRDGARGCRTAESVARS